MIKPSIKEFLDTRAEIDIRRIKGHKLIHMVDVKTRMGIVEKTGLGEIEDRILSEMASRLIKLIHE